MPSSTSNSNRKYWHRSWIGAILIALIVLAAMELFWRSHGHIPSVVDDERLWSVERNKVGTSPKEIVLLGSSRMQTDISIETLQRMLPDYSIINLSLDGTCANAVLHDLAADIGFKGIILTETTSECIMFGDNKNMGLSQQFYIDFYHNTYNLNVAVNRHIATYLQQNLVVINPYLNLIKVVADFFSKKQLRQPNYVESFENRSRAADYTKLDISRHKAIRLQKNEEHYISLKPDINFDFFTKQMSVMNTSVKTIQSRGGNVIFIRFPVTGEQWIRDEAFFPRETFWDPMVNITEAVTIHFRDIDSMLTLECPDTSHLDKRDTKVFTESLILELMKRRVFSYTQKIE